MSRRRTRSWSLTWIAAVAVAAVAAGGAAVGCELSCPEEEVLPIEDGRHHEVPMTNPPPRPALREVIATIEDDELTIQYVQDTDGRTYVVRLRERE